MPIPLDVKRKPASVKVHVSSGAGVDITCRRDTAAILISRTCASSVRCADVQRRAGEKGGAAGERRAIEKETWDTARSPALFLSAAPPCSSEAQRTRGSCGGQLRLADRLHDGHSTGNLQLRLFKDHLPLSGLRSRISICAGHWLQT